MALVEIGKKHDVYIGEKETLEDLKRDVEWAKTMQKRRVEVLKATDKVYQTFEERIRRTKAVIKEVEGDE